MCAATTKVQAAMNINCKERVQPNADLKGVGTRAATMLEYNKPPQNPKRTEAKSKLAWIVRVKVTAHRTGKELSQEFENTTMITPVRVHERITQAKSKWH